MPVKEKKERNEGIYLKKFGYAQLGDTEATKTPETYRSLGIEYNLSTSRLQGIVEKYRAIYGPKVRE